MIQCYFSSDGYYMHGDGIESVRRVSPLCGDDGKAIFDDLQHQYLVLFAMLGELLQRKLGYKIVEVYNYSRIIDDMNGQKPVDDFCLDVRTQLFQRIIPEVDGRIVFRKRSKKDVVETIEAAQSELLVPTGEARRIAEQQRATFERFHNQRVGKLRERWARMMEEKHGTG